MKKFSELNSINESVYRKEEVTFLLSTLGLDIRWFKKYII
jgi:hypothetical protein